MCRSGTVNTKEPRRRLIFQPTVCVLDFFFPPKFPYNRQTSRSAQQAMVEVCSPEEAGGERRVSRGREDPQEAEWAWHSGPGRVLCWRVRASVDCSEHWNLVITSHSLRFSTACFLIARNEGVCPCERWFKKHKYTNLSPSLLVYGPRTPPQNVSLA